MPPRPKSPRESLLAETVVIHGNDGDPIPAYMARPLAEEPRPAVIVLHHRAGWDWASKEITRRFAAEGFVAIMPHLHHRDAPGEPPEAAASIAQERKSVTDTRVLGDTRGAKQFVVQQPYCNGRIGIIGYCSGGRQAYMVACSTEFDACVVCYGGRIVASKEELSEVMPVAAIDMTPTLSAPVLGLFGRKDSRPSPEHVARLEEELQRHGKPYRFRIFEEAGHAFFAVDRDTYSPSAAVEGWVEIRDWFDEHL